jgi:hypothetical protein
MKRHYDCGTESDVSVFIGNEVESSIAYGMKTLFIVPDAIADIIEVIKNYEDYVEHVYLNANHCIIESDVLAGKYHDVLEYIEESTKIKYVTLEIFNYKSDQLALLRQYNKLLLNISIQIPKVCQLSDRISIKIDDIDFDATNSGVWTSRVDELLDKKMRFTPWIAYTKDEIYE